MFKTRLISGIILIVLALATILPGGLPLLLMVGFISVVGMLEFYGAMNVIRRNKAQVPAAGKEYEAKDPNALKSQVKEPMNALAAVPRRSGGGRVCGNGLCGGHAGLHLSDPHGV